MGEKRPKGNDPTLVETVETSKNLKFPIRKSRRIGPQTTLRWTKRAKMIDGPFVKKFPNSRNSKKDICSHAKSPDGGQRHGFKQGIDL